MYNATTPSLSKHLNRQEMNHRIGRGEVFGYEARMLVGREWRHMLTGSYGACVDLCNQTANATRITEVNH